MTDSNHPVVLVTELMESSGIELIERFATVLRPPARDEASILKLAPRITAAVVRVAPITAAVIDAAPHLRLVQKHGVGTDNIDIPHATTRGIPVCSTPEANYLAVAEHAVAAALAVVKRLPYQDGLVRGRRWREEIDPALPELDGLAIGVVGAGRAGRRVLTTMMRGFGMRGLAYDAFVEDARIRETGAEPCGSLRALLEQSDVVSLHVPLTGTTRNLIDAESLGWMRPSAVLVNTCRGGVVDEAALADALRAGRLAGAAIDVFEREPAVDTPLLDAPNVLLTPHNAGITGGSNRRMSIHSAQEAQRVLSGRNPLWCLNPEVLTPAPG